MEDRPVYGAQSELEQLRAEVTRWRKLLPWAQHARAEAKAEGAKLELGGSEWVMNVGEQHALLDVELAIMDVVGGFDPTPRQPAPRPKT